MGPHKEPPYSLWYLCIYDNGSKVRAELSRPIEFTAGYISKFIERIFILKDGDWEKVVLARRWMIGQLRMMILNLMSAASKHHVQPVATHACEEAPTIQ